jgi:hypothetical protein
VIVVDYSQAWCVEGREIARLKENGRRASKKNRRVIGRAIRYWQRKLKTSRSVCIPIVFGKVTLRKYGRPIDITYDRAPGLHEYVRINEEQLTAGLGAPILE